MYSKLLKCGFNFAAHIAYLHALKKSIFVTHELKGGVLDHQPVDLK